MCINLAISFLLYAAVCWWQIKELLCPRGDFFIIVLNQFCSYTAINHIGVNKLASNNSVSNL